MARLRKKFSIKRLLFTPPKGYDAHWRRALGPSPMEQLRKNKFSIRKLLGF